MTCCYTPLDSEALLHITGPDTLTFLQGQTTCDTRLVDLTKAALGAYCTPQGRTVCDFLLCQLGEHHYALRMRRDIIEHSASTFAKYIVFSKAELSTEQGDWRISGVWGDGAQELLISVFGSAPGAQYDTISGDGFTTVQLDSAAREFECYIDTSQCPELQQQLVAGAQLETSEAPWQTLQIKHGIARVEKPTAEEFIPQMLNYDLTGHISFDKGCYTGQEVVARLHYRGKPKRRCYVATLPAQLCPTAGTPLYTADSSQSVGNIVNCASADGNCTTLLVATAGGVEQGLLLEANDGPSLTMGELPYSIAAK